MKSLKYSYDPENDIMEIEGVKYMGELFRIYSWFTTPEDQYLKIQKEKGYLTLHQGTLCKYCKNKWIAGRTKK